MKKNKHIILGVTGSIAIYKSCEIIRQLRKDGCEVTVVMTREAGEFVKPALFQGLSGNRVYEGLFAAPGSRDIEHVSLAEKADVVLIAPATANIIGKISSGVCDDLLSCVVCATRAPVMICPAMNNNMFVNKVVQENIKKLRAFGYDFIGPKKGQLACGSAGMGCLEDVTTIVKEVKKALS
ncbi:MAG: flavoprotein [Candidatus Omnitrophica bacterium]|nr:flavoprotein [Candidatus Omnitrophota bacterium]